MSRHPQLAPGHERKSTQAQGSLLAHQLAAHAAALHTPRHSQDTQQKQVPRSSTNLAGGCGAVSFLLCSRLLDMAWASGAKATPGT